MLRESILESDLVGVIGETCNSTFSGTNSRASGNPELYQRPQCSMKIIFLTRFVKYREPYCCIIKQNETTKTEQQEYAQTCNSSQWNKCQGINKSSTISKFPV
jgi:hypothetical protein